MIRLAPRDHCAVLIIDGQAVRVLIGGTEPISDDTRAALEQLVRDCRDRLTGEPPAADDDQPLTSGTNQIELAAAGIAHRRRP